MTTVSEPHRLRSLVPQALQRVVDIVNFAPGEVRGAAGASADKQHGRRDLLEFRERVVGVQVFQ